MLTRLLASSGTEENIIKLISDYYFGSTISLTWENDIGKVSNLKGLIQNVRVIKKGKRYRFESC